MTSLTPGNSIFSELTLLDEDTKMSSLTPTQKDSIFYSLDEDTKMTTLTPTDTLPLIWLGEDIKMTTLTKNFLY